MARTWLHRAAENGAVARAVDLVERLDSSRPCWLRVLTYHRVDQSQPFARQMEHLADRYRVVSVPEVLTALDGGEPLPPRAVLLTFDDAYRSFAEVAWPILRRRGFAASLFVPTAYPGSSAECFWWDHLEQAFARTLERGELETPVGRLPLATGEQRAAAHAAVKRHVKDLAPRATLAVVRSLAAELGVEPGKHEVLDWPELAALARQSVSLGAHTRTHPRLDRVSLAEAQDEILGSVLDLEREIPGLPRIFAYPDGRFSDEIVDVVHGAGVELSFSTRPGANDLRTHDRLRLRRIHMDSRDSPGVFRAKLALGSARWNRVRRLLDPPSRAEREAEAVQRAERRRVRYFYRPLDAVLCAGLRPSEALLPALRRAVSARVSHYERVGTLVRLATSRSPKLEQRLARVLLDGTRLPFDVARLELIGCGSGATVFRLEPAGREGRALALKVYRRSLGRGPSALAQLARRYRARHDQLRSWFGDLVLPGEFLVLHGPLRGQPSVACLQEMLAGPPRDPLALGDAELCAWLRRDAALSHQFADFARRTLALRAQGFLPDLLGRGNLLVLERGAEVRLQLVDYGVFDLRSPHSPSVQRALEAIAQRLKSLLSWIDHHEVLLHHESARPQPGPAHAPRR